ncbi:MAG: 50S ribosomal protein L34e [Desulfurococcaceae archaeon TW002]
MRSRSLRRVWRRTPGGKTVIHYRRSKPHVAVCGVCGSRLGGVPTSTGSLRKVAKSSKRPERIFGGVFCPSCLSIALKYSVRGS